MNHPLSIRHLSTDFLTTAVNLDYQILDSCVDKFNNRILCATRSCDEKKLPKLSISYEGEAKLVFNQN